ncbi:hypothetical protein OBK04_11655 [Empedobacter falsenii]
MMNLEKVNNLKFLLISIALILIGYSINLIGWNIRTITIVYFGLGLFFLGIISFIILLFLALIKIVNRI